jgi:hypothetical protein
MKLMKIPYAHRKVRGGYEILFYGIRVGFVKTSKEAKELIDKANSCAELSRQLA